MDARYDRIGLNYAALRRPDPRLAAAIEAALGPAETILNVGAGTGSYEPAGRRVTAVEPSLAMIRRRPPAAAPAVQACAESLPFADASFDAAMAILTVHHWADKAAGLAEMRRVTRGRLVLLTFDPAVRPWLVDYLPALAALDEAQMPAITDYERWLGPVEIVPVPIPHDCSDGFLYAWWRRPEAYLDPHIRSGSSSFWALGEAADAGLARLQRDLETGAWARLYPELLSLDSYDAGYRLVVAG
jgi:SAM-dependent methyltransferase